MCLSPWVTLTPSVHQKSTKQNSIAVATVTMGVAKSSRTEMGRTITLRTKKEILSMKGVKYMGG